MRHRCAPLFMTALCVVLVSLTAPCNAMASLDTTPTQATTNPPITPYVSNSVYECDLSGAGGGNLNGCPASSGGGYLTASGALLRNPINATSAPACGTNNSYCGARTDAASTSAGSQAVIPIYAYNVCEWVDNYTNESLFVPFGINSDWADFRANAPLNTKGNIKLTGCVLPYYYIIANTPNVGAQTSILPPYSDCPASAAQKIYTPNVYARQQNTSSRSQAYWPYPAITPTNAASVTNQTSYPTASFIPSFTCGNAIITSFVQWKSDSTDTYWTAAPNFSPNMTLTASSNTPPTSGTTITVPSGTAVTLTWSSTGTTAIGSSSSSSSSSSCSLSSTSTSISNGASSLSSILSASCSSTSSSGWDGVIFSSSNNAPVIVHPTTTTTYTLTSSNIVTNADGSGTTTLTTSVSVTVIVTPVQLAPTVTLTASPSTINAGDRSMLTWTVSNNATSCTASGDSSFTGSISPNGGSTYVSPSITTLYSVVCSNSSGTSTPASVTVTVNNEETAMMDIVGFYTESHCGREGGCSYSTQNASANATVLANENQIVGATDEATQYTGIDYKIVLFSSNQQYYSGTEFIREGGSAYQVYTPVPCKYAGDIEAGYQCFATAVTYHTECTTSDREGCNAPYWEQIGSITSIGYTGIQYPSDGWALNCPNYPYSAYGACYH